MMEGDHVSIQDLGIKLISRDGERKRCNNRELNGTPFPENEAGIKATRLDDILKTAHPTATDEQPPAPPAR